MTTLENPVAKLNRKKKSDDIVLSLTKETRSNFSVQPSSSGKVLIFRKPIKKFTIKDMRHPYDFSL